MIQKRVAILILAKNEEHSISSVIAKCQNWTRTNSNISSVIAVIDDSTDATGTVAEGLGAIVVKGGGLGLGHSYILGVQWAIDQGADWIFTIDGDGQTPLEELPLFWQTMLATDADLILGSRFLRRNLIEYDYPMINRLGVWALSSALTLFSGTVITDSHGGIRLFNKRAAQSFRLKGRHTYVQETILSAARDGLKIVEIESAWKQRQFGESRVVRSKLKYIARTTYPLLAAGSEALWSRLRR